jgi:outer membrane protein assembly factor BamB
MNLLKAFFIATFLLFGSASLSAKEQRVKNSDIDNGFEQERMVLDQGHIFIVSSFDAEDHLTVYSFYGTLIWDASFHAKILSWQVVGDYVIVFSKDRGGQRTYLTSIDRMTGKIIWQRP